MSLLSFLSNPITFAAVTVITIGAIVYGIINQQKEEVVTTRRGRRRNSGRCHMEPDTSSITTYRNSGESIRCRKSEKTETKTCEISGNKVDGKSSATVKKSEFSEKNYCQNVFDKMENDVKNINQKDEKKKDFDKFFNDDSDSIEDNDLADSNEDNVPADSNGDNVPADSKEDKLVNSSISGTNVEDTCQNFCRASTSREVDNKRENVSINESTKQTKIGNSNFVSTTAQNVEQNVTNSDINNCMACEEMFPNAVAYPCNHRYLCIDCATIIHRIYKKCTICDSIVETFETFER